MHFKQFYLESLLRSDGAIVLDCRSPEAFASYIPGSLNVHYGSSFAT